MASIFNALKNSKYPGGLIVSVAGCSGAAAYIFKDLINSTTYYKVYVPNEIKESNRELEMEVLTLSMVPVLQDLFMSRKPVRTVFDTERHLKVQGPLTVAMMEELLHNPSSDLYTYSALGLTSIKTGLITGLIGSPWVFPAMGVVAAIMGLQHLRLLPSQSRTCKTTKVIFIDEEMPTTVANNEFNVVLTEFKNKHAQ